MRKVLADRDKYADMILGLVSRMPPCLGPHSIVLSLARCSVLPSLPAIGDASTEIDPVHVEKDGMVQGCWIDPECAVCYRTLPSTPIRARDAWQAKQIRTFTPKTMQHVELFVTEVEKRLALLADERMVLKDDRFSQAWPEKRLDCMREAVAKKKELQALVTGNPACVKGVWCHQCWSCYA